MKASDKNQIAYLRQQVSGNNRFSYQRKFCIITAVIPQGDILYAIARYPSTTVTNTDGTTTTTQGGYVGNEGNIPVAKLLLPEISIQTDINLANYKGYNVTGLIGQQAQAEFFDGRPQRLLISNLGSQDPRTISTAVIQGMRSTNNAQDLTDPSALDFVTNNGISATDFNNILKESVETINPDGNVLVYGNLIDWLRESQQSTNSSYKDISSYSNPTSVSGLPTKQLPTHVCYDPPTIFAGF